MLIILNSVCKLWYVMTMWGKLLELPDDCECVALCSGKIYGTVPSLTLAMGGDWGALDWLVEKSWSVNRTKALRVTRGPAAGNSKTDENNPLIA
jgi:hypothetical protein